VVAGTTIFWADTNVVYRTEDKGQNWSEESCPIGTITSLSISSIGDLVAAGIDSSGKVGVAREKSGQNGWQVLDTPVPSTLTATNAQAVMQTYPGWDGVVVTATTTVKSDSFGVWISAWNNPTWARIDGGNQVNQGIGISIGQTTGTVEEGPGITYACTLDSIIRIRGSGNQAEKITIPSNLGVSSILWFAQTFVDAGAGAISPININVGVDNDGDGKIEKILNYRDTLDVTVTGVKASFIPQSSSAVVSWNPVSGSTNYAVFVSSNKQTNFYTAMNDPGVTIKYNPGDTVAWVSGLLSQNYYITVWAVYPLTSFYGNTRLTTD
jgi:hypothetical protein